MSPYTVSIPPKWQRKPPEKLTAETQALLRKKGYEDAHSDYDILFFLGKTPDNSSVDKRRNYFCGLSWQYSTLLLEARDEVARSENRQTQEGERRQRQLTE